MRRSQALALVGSLGCLLECPPVEAREALPPLVFLERALSTESHQIISGQRVERDAAGALHFARDLFPLGGEARGILLPQQVGGGVLFVQALFIEGRASSVFWHAESWTGPLQAVARFSGLVQEVEWGWDRLYFRLHGRPLAFDWLEKKVVPPAPFPVLAEWEKWKFGEGQTAAIQTPLLGVVLTRDAGLQFSKLDPSAQLQPDEGIVITSRVSAPLSVRARRGVGAVRTGGELLLSPQGRRESQLWQNLLLTGVQTDAGYGMLAHGEWVELRVSATGGLSWQTRPTELRGDCVGLPGSAPPSFLCADPEFSWVQMQAGRPKVLHRLSGARQVLAQSAQGVLLARSCAGEAPGLCWMTPEFKRSLPQPEFPVLSWGVSGKQVVALARAAESGLVLHQLESPGKSRTYFFQEGEEWVSQLQQGRWLPQLEENSEGWGGWLTSGESFVGALFSAEGPLELGPLQSPVRRALFAGRRALLWGASGFVRETRDQGFSWQELLFPFQSGDTDPLSSAREIKMGCSSLGCVVGDRFLLAPLDTASPPQEKKEAPSLLDSLPEPVRLPPSGGGRYQFTCSARSGNPGSSQRTEWSASFAGHPLPVAPLGQEIWQVESRSGTARLWVSGPPQGSWAREAQMQLFFRFPFAERAVRATLRGRAPFENAEEAAAVFGSQEYGANHVQEHWLANGEGGLLFFRSQGETQVFSFAEGEPLVPFSGAEDWGVQEALGVVRVGETWYMARREQNELAIWRAEGNKWSAWVRFPLGNSTPRELRLVSSGEGELAIALLGEGGLFIYPLSEQGELDWPFLSPHRGSRPPFCEQDTPGFWLMREMSVAPWMQSPSGQLEIHQVRALERVGPGWICLQALSGATSQDVSAHNPREGRPSQVRSIPLSLVRSGTPPQVETWWCEE